VAQLAKNRVIDIAILIVFLYNFNQKKVTLLPMICRRVQVEFCFVFKKKKKSIVFDFLIF
jgi:hypothetical protein